MTHDPEASARLRLTETVGRQVDLPDGTRLGRVADLTIELGSAHPQVRRVLIRGARRVGHLVPAHHVVDPSGATPRFDSDRHLQVDERRADALADQRMDADHPELVAGELLLRRDVLDTQVVDLRGRRLTRVSDVILSREGDDSLAVHAVDLGLAGILRRLGLHRLALRAPSRTIDWRDLHLTSPRGHVVQLGADDAAFRRLDPGGLAELLTRLSTSRAMAVLQAVEPGRAAAAIALVHPHVRRRLVPGPWAGQPCAPTAPSSHDRTERRYRRTAGWRLHRPPGT